MLQPQQVISSLARTLTAKPSAALLNACTAKWLRGVSREAKEQLDGAVSSLV